MEHIFAPWRKDFIEKKDKEPGCIFCSRVKSKPSADNLVIHKSKHSFILLNKYPYNSGHLMVAPYRHTADFSELSVREMAELAKNIQLALSILKEAYDPEGFNIGMNLGKIAGAGVADHMHWHIVPRWGGDTNFMPVVGKTKVLHEMLEASFDRLYPLFKKIKQ
jgi:ATP adenylyltransferase